MMPNLDRFAVGLEDPQEYEPRKVGHCPTCDEELHEGEEVREWNEFYFCDADCLAEKIGAEKVVA